MSIRQSFFAGLRDQPLHQRFNTYHGNPKPSFLGVITYILGVQNLHFSWFWGSKGRESKGPLAVEIRWTAGFCCRSPASFVPCLGVWRGWPVAMVDGMMAGCLGEPPLDVSENKGTPKWMVYNGKPYLHG